MNPKTLTFRTVGNQSLNGVVKNPNATLGTIAAKAARHLGLAGTFECLDRESRVLNPDTPLADLPADEEITLASELTPAGIS